MLSSSKEKKGGPQHIRARVRWRSWSNL